MAPMSIGYFNDGVAVAAPTSHASVLEDETARFVSPYAAKDTDAEIKLKVIPKLDPWTPTNAAIYTAV